VKHSGIAIPKGFKAKAGKDGRIMIEKAGSYGGSFRQKLAAKAKAKKPKYGKART
jgi:hypothetical protein